VNYSFKGPQDIQSRFLVKSMPLYITAVLVALRRPTQNRQMVLICG